MKVTYLQDWFLTYKEQYVLQKQMQFYMNIKKESI